MHIPDGFISPKVYVPMYALGIALWMIGLKKIKAKLNEKTIPVVATLTAFSFIVMMISVPLPGGTSAHATGMALLAISFGIWTSFICISMVLLIQALFFAMGGVTSFPINALAMGFVGSVVAYYAYRLIFRINKNIAMFAAGWLATVLSALVIAFILGIQPHIAHTESGDPLFFPFSLSITLPAIMIPHVLIGIGEGVLTVIVCNLLKKINSAYG